mmetsp:Transcript_1212/g.3390  ORF Transcript_1212/g.3390 Transcript_1212/m.3390 type:complete len:533 (-) Transcript_1212:22-1620(-)
MRNAAGCSKTSFLLSRELQSRPSLGTRALGPDLVTLFFAAFFLALGLFEPLDEGRGVLAHGGGGRLAHAERRRLLGVVEPLDDGFFLRRVGVIEHLEHQRSLLGVLVARDAHKGLHRPEQRDLLRLVLGNRLEVLDTLRRVLCERLVAVSEDCIDVDLHPGVQAFNRLSVEGVLGDVLAGLLLVEHLPERDREALLGGEAHVGELFRDFVGVSVGGSGSGFGLGLAGRVDRVLVLLLALLVLLPLLLLVLLRLRVELLAELLALPVLPPHLVGGLLLGRLVLGRMLDDEGVQLVARVHVRHVAAGLASQRDVLLAVHLDDGLRVAARVALHELLDEALQDLRQSARVVRAVDYRLARVVAEARLRAELAPEVLGRVARGPTERLRDVHHVHHVCLHAVAAPFHPRLELGHLVAVKRVVRIVRANVNRSHVEPPRSPSLSIFSETSKADRVPSLKAQPSSKKRAARYGLLPQRRKKKTSSPTPTRPSVHSRIRSKVERGCCCCCCWQTCCRSSWLSLSLVLFARSAATIDAMP